MESGINQNRLKDLDYCFRYLGHAWSGRISVSAIADTVVALVDIAHIAGDPADFGDSGIGMEWVETIHAMATTAMALTSPEGRFSVRSKYPPALPGDIGCEPLNTAAAATPAGPARSTRTALTRRRDALWEGCHLGLRA
jgi:hypothetical protein